MFADLSLEKQAMEEHYAKEVASLAAQRQAAGLSSKRLESAAGVCAGRPIPGQLRHPASKLKRRADTGNAAGLIRAASELRLLKIAPLSAQKGPNHQP